MTFPTLLTVTMTIGGVDVTGYVKPGSLVVDNILTQQVDTLACTLEGIGAISFEDWQEVLLLDGSTRIFGGYLLTKNNSEGADLGINKVINASDFSIRLEKVIVKEEFIGKTDAYILNYLFTKYLPGEGFDAVVHVDTLKTHDRIRFNRVTLLDCIKQLANLSNADYYVDYYKYLYYFEAGTEASVAPFALNQNPDYVTSFPYSNLSVNEDGAGVVNRVEVVGGNYRSDDNTFYLAGTGQDNHISLPFRLHAPDGQTSIQVWRNDGTQAVPIWTPLTVLVGYIDELTASTEVLFYFAEKLIEQQASWPALPNAVKITAKYEVPLRTRVRDQASYDHYGLWLDDVIVDQTITDKGVARLAGLAMLAKNSMNKVAITLKIDQPGIRSGQIVTITNALHSINSGYSVQKVSTKIGINGRAYYTVSLGTYNPSLVDLIIRLAKQAQPKVAWSDDEVLDEVLQMAEKITLIESNSVTATTGPYYFSENPAQAFIWGFGAFQP
jgi:hypothetical protein